MKLNPKLMTASVAIIAAAATAHLMQRNSAEAARGTTDQPTVQTAGVMPGAFVPAPSVIAADPDMPPPTDATAKPEMVTSADPVAEIKDTLTTTEANAVVANLDDPVSELETAVSAERPDTPEPAIQLASVSTSVTDAPVVASDPTDSLPAFPQPPSVAANPSPLPQVGLGLQDRMAVLDQSDRPTTGPDAAAGRNEFGLTCGTILSASVQPSAIVNLTVTSPCRNNEEIQVRHGHVTYTDKMSRLGMYTAQIPALASEAEFTLVFSDGEEVSTIIDVPEVDAIERVALQTSANSGLQVHALEFGADYGEAGHIWSGTPSDPATASLTNGGYFLLLGDVSNTEGQIVKIYTFPTTAETRDGVVRVSIEAEVTTQNCATEVSGRILQKTQSTLASPVALTLSIPDCDAIGEYLVLKNLLRDMKVAAN